MSGDQWVEWVSSSLVLRANSAKRTTNMKRRRGAEGCVRIFAGRCSLLALVGAAGGCKSPLWSHPSDFGQQTPRERLRDIQPLHVERYAAPPTPPPAEGAAVPDQYAEAKARFESLEQVNLSLEEGRVSALRNNLDLRVALVDPRIAATRVSLEEAAFEAAFTTRALWQKTDTPTSSSLTDAQREFGLIEPGVTIPLRTGGTATISLPITRDETNNTFSTLNPAHTSDLQFSISHDLLRGAGRRVNVAGITIASYNQQAVEAQTKLQVIQELSDTDRRYWELYRARGVLDVAQQQYELAQAQLERAERQVRAGRAAEIEVVRAQSGVAERLGAIISSQNAVLQRQRDLKRVINMPGLDVDSPQMIVPTTLPDPVEYTFDPEELAKVAVNQRMELLETELRLLADAVNIDVTRNGLLPRLTLDATYRINGLGGTLDDSFEELADNRFEDFSIGANLLVPLGNEAAKSRFREAVLTRLQRLGTYETRHQTIRQEVYDAVDRIASDWQRILANRQATILATRTLQAEQRQFDVGRATSNDVLDATTNLAQTQLAELQAVVDYQLGQVALAQATGTLLGAAKVAWEPRESALDPGTPEPPHPDAQPVAPTPAPGAAAP